MLALFACESEVSTTSPTGAPESELAVAKALDWDRLASEALAESGHPGAVVVLSAQTGAVLANVERAGQSLHPATLPRAPGSVVKPILALAALHEGVIGVEESVSCAGARQIDGESFVCFFDHGELALHEGLQTSCNHYAFELAARLGYEQIERHFARFGISSDGPATHPAVMGTGHGEVVLSPLELAQAYVLLAGGQTPATGSDWPYREQELQEIRASLREAVEHEQGTGTRAAVANLAVAGKTGTADTVVGDTSLRLNLFAGWAPAQNPEVIVVVQLEGEGSGGEVAAPVASRIFAALVPKA